MADNLITLLALALPPSSTIYFWIFPGLVIIPMAFFLPFSPAPLVYLLYLLFIFSRRDPGMWNTGALIVIYVLLLSIRVRFISAYVRKYMNVTSFCCFHYHFLMRFVICSIHLYIGIDYL